MADEGLMVDDDILETIEELRTNYPLVSAILDKVPEMGLEEAGIDIGSAFF